MKHIHNFLFFIYLHENNIFKDKKFKRCEDFMTLNKQLGIAAISPTGKWEAHHLSGDKVCPQYSTQQKRSSAGEQQNKYGSLAL